LLDTSRFAMGLALAFALRDPAAWMSATLSKGWLAVACGLVMLADLDLAQYVDTAWVPMHSLAIGVLVAVVIGHVVTRPEQLLARLLSLPVLVKVGVMSYSLYLWHFPIFNLLEDGVTISGHTGLRLVLKAVLTAAATYLSWRFVESRTSRRRASAPATTVTAPAV